MSAPIKAVERALAETRAELSKARARVTVAERELQATRETVAIYENIEAEHLAALALLSPPEPEPGEEVTAP